MPKVWHKSTTHRVQRYQRAGGTLRNTRFSQKLNKIKLRRQQTEANRRGWVSHLLPLLKNVSKKLVKVSAGTTLWCTDSLISKSLDHRSCAAVGHQASALNTNGMKQSRWFWTPTTEDVKLLNYSIMTNAFKRNCLAKEKNLMRLFSVTINNVVVTFLKTGGSVAPFVPRWGLRMLGLSS